MTESLGFYLIIRPLFVSKVAAGHPKTVDWRWCVIPSDWRSREVIGHFSRVLHINNADCVWHESYNFLHCLRALIFHLWCLRIICLISLSSEISLKYFSHVPLANRWQISSLKSDEGASLIPLVKFRHVTVIDVTITHYCMHAHREPFTDCDAISSPKSRLTFETAPCLNVSKIANSLWKWLEEN